MNREKLISDLYNCPQFRSRCKGMAKGDLYQDLINHVILIICEKTDDELKAMVSINSYAYGIAFRQYHNRNSSFRKTYGLNELSNELNKIAYSIAEEEKTTVDEDHNITINVIEKDLQKSISEDRFPVQQEIFQTYLKLGTIRKVSAFYNISKSTVGRMIQDYRERIKLNFDKQ